MKRVNDEVGNKARIQLCNQVPEQVHEQVYVHMVDEVWNQVMLQVGVQVQTQIDGQRLRNLPIIPVGLKSWIKSRLKSVIK